MKKFGTLLVLLSLVTFSFIGCKREAPTTPPEQPPVEEGQGTSTETPPAGESTEAPAQP